MEASLAFARLMRLGGCSCMCCARKCTSREAASLSFHPSGKIHGMLTVKSSSPSCTKISLVSSHSRTLDRLKMPHCMQHLCKGRERQALNHTPLKPHGTATVCSILICEERGMLYLISDITLYAAQGIMHTGCKDRLLYMQHLFRETIVCT